MARDPGHPAVYLRCREAEDIAIAVRSGADGVSLELRLDGSGSVRVGNDLLEELVALAEDSGLAVELVVGAAFDPQPMTSLVAATVATMVAAQRVRETVRLSSFDHAAVTSIGHSASKISLGLRHLVTLSQGEEYARRSGAASLHPMAGEVQAADVERARAAGIVIHAWTLVVDLWPIDEPTQLREALPAGVDAVTITDPALIAIVKETTR